MRFEPLIERPAHYRVFDRQQHWRAIERLWEIMPVFDERSGLAKKAISDPPSKWLNARTFEYGLTGASVRSQIEFVQGKLGKQTLGFAFCIPAGWLPEVSAPARVRVQQPVWVPRRRLQR